ncbi:uncharacterized protein [Fopius arisanus]|uniref:Uncharacterized protein isoform X2 n=1 Tax=Fopius arisanus TaxID=64838 RepID=A0A9R1T2V9_9HYME|nr:PREDICTED: uncharacterized protein LOC105265844 isoform X2 [Fopius arisanus]
MDYAGRIGAKTRASEESRAEEMKRELSALNLYEGGMTMKEMYHMLTAVKDSMKNPGDMSRENSMATEMISTPPAEPPSQKPARSSRDSSSPELTSAYFSTRVRPTTKKPEEEDLDDSPECTRMSPTIGALHILSPSPPRLGTLSTAPAAVPPLQSTTNIPKKIQNTRKLPLSKIEIWKIDPLDCKTVDVPLKNLQRNQSSRPPVGFPVENRVPQIPETIRRFIDMSLLECHKSHYENHKYNYSIEFEWGSPIKVTTGLFKESPDKDFRSEREIQEFRPGLRSRDISPKKSDVFAFNQSDDDSDDFERTRKRPKSSTSGLLGPVSSLAGRRERALFKANISPPQELSKSEEKGPNWEERPRVVPSKKRTVKNRGLATPEVSRSTREALQEFEPQEIPAELSKTASPPPKNSEAVDVYPRRITPPNPSRPRGPKGKKLLSIPRLLGSRPQLTVEKIPRKKPESLTEEEIESSVMTDDEDDAPIVPQKTSKRSEAALALLERARQEDMTEERRRVEMERARAEQEDREKQERIRKRIRENNALIKVKQEEATLEKERRERYKFGMVVNMGRRVELEGDSAKKNVEILEWDSNNRATPTADEVSMFPEGDEDNQEAREVQCPMCQKYFPQGRAIEIHADSCADSFGDGGDVVDVEEVKGNHPPGRGRFSNLLECMRCGKFQTRDGHEFDEHTVKCLRNQEVPGGSKTVPIEVPDSPIRSFKPLSEIHNPEIDYNAQTRTRKASPKGGNNRKRRKILKG